MRCLRPITLKTGDVVPCGKCLPCKINVRNSWNLRLRYEAANSVTSLFIGLTYSDDFLHFTPGGHPTLFPQDIDDLLLSLRYRFKKYGYKFRYYLIGEYGADTRRPHYHIQFFSDFPLPYENCFYASQQDHSYCSEYCKKNCPVREIVSLWYLGHVTAFPCTPADIGYITLLHVTGIEPPFPDAHPCFRRFSRRPGLGDGFFSNRELVSRIFSSEQPYFTYTPDGVLTALPRYYRDRIFTRAERKYLSLGVPDDPSAVVKSHQFTHDWKKNSWKSKGKM